MLKSSDLIIQSELEVFEAIERWLLFVLEQNGDEAFIERANNLLPLVRFPRMPILDLRAVCIDTVFLPTLPIFKEVDRCGIQGCLPR